MRLALVVYNVSKSLVAVREIAMRVEPGRSSARIRDGLRQPVFAAICRKSAAFTSK